MKKLLAMLLAAMMVFTVVGCEQKPATTETEAPAETATPAETEAPVETEAPAEIDEVSADITGTYKLSGAEMDGVVMSAEEMGAPEMGIILDADGTVTLTSEGESETGTWALEGNELILTSDEGDVMTMTLEDGNLVMEESGIKMIFSK
ncbi:MAG: hypothetical protein IKW04_01485 [Clostridia bacterium]|nr:hypothetical protein [Clostridia bacterium]